MLVGNEFGRSTGSAFLVMLSCGYSDINWVNLWKKKARLK